MGITKTDIFTPQQNALSAVAKTLGHPARIAIIQQLLQTNACVCGDLVDQIGLAQATVSQHLKALKEQGLIKGNISGASVCYCLDAERWAEIRPWFDSLFQQVELQNQCCT